MAQVKIYSETDSSKCRTVENFTEIQNELKKVNIDLERWIPKSKLGLEANQEEILAAYADQVNQVMRGYGFSSVDVISMNSSIPAEKILELRKKFRKFESRISFLL